VTTHEVIDRPERPVAMNDRTSSAAVIDGHGPAAAEGTDPRLIALYLPQYHPIPENDAWWGKGFTEWTNVTRARPLFRGHDQPHLPADLGFYDLRLPETRRAQAELAREYGLGGFCYYHYWFNGRRLLERPFAEVLASGTPDFPFCLCWANENWTRTWDGQDRQVLMEQRYGREDDLAHIRSLIPAFHDPRYIRVEGKPLFLVYRGSKLPDPAETTRIWRQEAERHGLGGLFLCRVESFPTEQSPPPEAWGFDAAVEFAPEYLNLGPLLRRGPRWDRARRLRLTGDLHVRHNFSSYPEAVARAIAKPLPPYELFRCATPQWDNTARRPVSGGWILHGSTPDLYRRWLTALIEQARTKPPGRRIVFINAWNEWAEGNHLEPCMKWGRAYLEATRRALSPASGTVDPALRAIRGPG
jgi:lipopolysaccharide biosynthesis protein